MFFLNKKVFVAILMGTFLTVGGYLLATESKRSAPTYRVSADMITGGGGRSTSQSFVEHHGVIGGLVEGSTQGSASFTHHPGIVQPWEFLASAQSHWQKYR